jgi:hypothetical protein
VKRLALLVVFLGVAACGAGGFGDDTGDDTLVDGGPSGDGDVCDVGVTFMPTTPTAGDTVVATAALPASGDFFDFEWTVARGGGDVPFSLAAIDGSRIMFTASAAGPHYVTLDVSGTPCQGFDGSINVRVPGATDSPWRLRFTAAPGIGVPPQERVVVVPSAADFDYGTVVLDPGAQTTGTLTDGNGTPIPGYVRLTPAGSPDLVLDAFAGSTGAFTISSALEPHDVLIIPLAAGLAPLGLTDWTPVGGALEVDAGTAVTGTVLDPGGVGVVGATVTVRVNGVPSTVGTTTAGGAFTVRARPASGALVTVDVVPPAGSGLPRLKSAPGVLDLAMPVAVTYSAALVRRAVGGATVTLGGGAAANAKITFVGTVGTAGLVATGVTQAAASGTFAIELTANGSGVLPTADIPATETEVVVHLGTAWGVVDVDLTTAAPGAIAAPGAAAISGRVVDPQDAPVTAATLRATPRGALAAAGALERTIAVAVDGTFATTLPDGADFELLITDRDADLALLRSSVAVSGAANLGDLVLPDGLALTGKVALAGGSAPGVAVTMFCDACSAAEQTRPAAEAATDTGGRYRATVLDPGVP